MKIKQLLYIIGVLMFIMNCKSNNDYATFYEYSVINQLDGKIIKIISKSESDFWITKADTFIVMPQERIIIGSTIFYSSEKTAIDIYNPNDTILSFDILIDSFKQEMDYSQRKKWSFNINESQEIGEYKLLFEN